MPIEATLNLANAIFLIASSTIPIYLAFKAKPSPIKTLSLLLSSFIVTHGIYHLIAYIETETLELIGELAIEPLSWLFLLTFSIYYAKRAA